MLEWKLLCNWQKADRSAEVAYHNIMEAYAHGVLPTIGQLEEVQQLRSAALGQLRKIVKELDLVVDK